MWRDTKVENKTLWHITKKEKVNSIKENGILISDSGQVGAGVYSIIPDLDVLENLMEFFSLEKKYQPNLLAIVEFIYTGEVVESPVENFIFANEGWVKTNEPIAAENIISIQNYTEFNMLEKIN